MEQMEEINDESDHELKNPKGYYTRAKRRKLSEKYLEKEEASTSGLYRVPELGKRKNPIMFVPTEVLQHIFKHISYHELSTKVRLVSRRFKTVAEDLLNLGFRKIEKKLEQLITTTDVSLGYTQDDMEIKCISKLLCMLEVLNLQYSIIVSTIWRYVYNDFYKSRKACMYGGLIIDTHESFIWKFLHCPNQLYAPAVVRDYAFPQEVSKIIQMTKTFCIHFDKTNEETMSNSCVLSGCKILDILDCAKFCQKTVRYEGRSSDVFLARYSYFFKNSWFIAMPIPPSKEMDWPQQQRMMHMRLRRIVLAHNDMYLQQEQYDREVMLRPAAPIVIKKPGNNVYTGYGDVEDTFFYYGVMNDGAYASKFHSEDDNDEQDDEEDMNEGQVPNERYVEVARASSDEDVLYRLPYLGFRIEVSVRCPASFAPYNFLRTLTFEEQTKLKKKSCSKVCVGQLNAKMANNIEIKYTKLFISNSFVDSLSKKTFPTINPGTGEKIADVAEAQKEDVDIAVAAAKKAFSRNSPWRNMDASQRGRLINKFADLLDRDSSSLAELETLNSGKPLEGVKYELEVYANTLRYYAGYCDKIHGSTIPVDGKGFCVTKKEPVGVVAQIIPWNYPVGMAIWKLGPALCTGCTLILKPAEQTPLTALVLAALSKEAGFPDGVINVLPGYGPVTGEALCLHNDVRKVAFTGSTDIGHEILEYSAKSNLKRVSLELGGKSPLVIFDDADLNQAVNIAHEAIFANHGQNCCAGSRTFVQSGIYEAFVKKAVEKAKARKVGDPFTASVKQGPQIDQPSLDKILRIVGDSQKQGAKLETGGSRIGNKGFFVEPTVFSGVTDDMSCAVNEIFGPVQSILKFDTLDEVIQRANNTDYGLAAGVITKNINNALVFANAVEAGSVWVNSYQDIRPQTPFGGYKKSGFGKDLGADSLNDYLNTKVINVLLPTKN